MRKLATILVLLVSQVAFGQVWLTARPGLNQSRTIFSSTLRIATPTAVTVANPSSTGVMLVIDCTRTTDSPSVVFTVAGYDSASASYVTLLTSAAITDTSTTILTIFPGATVTSNVSANRPIPGLLRISAAHADADTITYSVGAWFY